MKDELGEYLGPDAWEQTTTSLNLGTHSTQAQHETTAREVEQRKLSLIKSGFNVPSTTALHSAPHDEAILSDTEPRSGDDVEREQLDLNPGRARKSDKKTRVKLQHTRRHSLDSTRDIGVPFSEEFKSREARRRYGLIW